MIIFVVLKSLICRAESDGVGRIGRGGASPESGAAGFIVCVGVCVGAVVLCRERKRIEYKKNENDKEHELK